MNNGTTKPRPEFAFKGYLKQKIRPLRADLKGLILLDSEARAKCPSYVSEIQGTQILILDKTQCAQPQATGDYKLIEVLQEAKGELPAACRKLAINRMTHGAIILNPESQFASDQFTSLASKLACGFTNFHHPQHARWGAKTRTFSPSNKGKPTAAVWQELSQSIKSQGLNISPDHALLALTNHLEITAASITGDLETTSLYIHVQGDFAQHPLTPKILATITGFDGIMFYHHQLDRGILILSINGQLPATADTYASFISYLRSQKVREALPLLSAS